MTFKKEEIAMAAKCLKENGFINLGKCLMEMSESKDDYYDNVDLINRSHYFATVLWDKTDIENDFNILAQGKYELTDDVYDRIMNILDIDEIESCEHGWNVIDYSIEDVIRELDFESEE